MPTTRYTVLAHWDEGMRPGEKIQCSSKEAAQAEQTRLLALGYDRVDIWHIRLDLVSSRTSHGARSRPELREVGGG